jgi:formylglycine-generating enzyme required for sulfatase activity
MTDFNLKNWRNGTAADRNALVGSVRERLGAGYDVDARQREANDGYVAPGFIERASGLRWLAIPGGTFSMGCSVAEEAAARAIEDPPPLDFDTMRPVHVESIAPFLVTEAPLSRAVAERVVGEKALSGRMYGDLPPDSAPAFVTRQEAERIATSMKSRLIGEAQWEYLCRAGTDSLFFFGSELNAVGRWVEPDLLRTAPNPLGAKGLFVGEWCADLYRPTYDQKAAEEVYACRSGASLFWPWQDAGEWAFCVSARRVSSADIGEEGHCGIRLVREMR